MIDPAESSGANSGVDSGDEFSRALVLRLRRGDTEAGETLERLHRVALLRFARRYLGNDHDAEDAVQEVFARILTTDAEPRDFRTWSYRIARNVCLNQLRSRGRRRDAHRLATGLDVEAQQTGALTRLVHAEDGAQLGSALERLSDAQREVLILRYLEGLGREEIADVLELSVSVVKSRLFEGVSRLRKLSSD